MICAILLSSGLLTILVAKQTSEEVLRIATMFVGLLLLLWGLSLAPTKIQIIVEIIVIVIIFPVCTRCNQVTG